MKKKIESVIFEKIVFPDNDILRSLFGEHDRNVKLIEKLEAVKLGIRGNVISVTGNQTLRKSDSKPVFTIV